MRPVRVASFGVFAHEAAGAIPTFQARDHVPDRKHAKLMSRSVQLGVAAIQTAIRGYPGWNDVPPERRGMFVGTSPGGGEPEDLLPALEEGTVRGRHLEGGTLALPDRFDMRSFGERGFPLVPPLWLVRGLTNNVVGFASAYFETRGPNTTRCDGRMAGIAAILDGWRAVAEGRADVVVAGGTDSLVHAVEWWPIPVGEGAAFFVLEAGDAGPAIEGGAVAFDAEVEGASPEVDIGAAQGPVALARAIAAGHAARVTVDDPWGGRAWIEVGAQPS
jgi:hypothetical protein